jgi:hypothetical protein
MAIPFSLRPGDKLTYFPFNAIIKRFHLKMLLNNVVISGRITLKQDIFSLISVNVVNENNIAWGLRNLPLFKTFKFRDGIYIRKGLDLMLETNIASSNYKDIVFEIEVEETNANYFHNYFDVFVLGENQLTSEEPEEFKPEKFIYIPSYSDKELRRIIAEGFINEIKIFTHPKHNALSISAFDNLDFETSHHQLWDYYPYATYDDIVLDVNEVNVEYMLRVYSRWVLSYEITGLNGDLNIRFTHPFSFIVGAEFYDKEIRV